MATVMSFFGWRILLRQADTASSDQVEFGIDNRERTEIIPLPLA
jgi:hypothetical protein